MYIGHVALLIINLPMVGLSARFAHDSKKYLTPLLVVHAFIGVYSAVSNPFDLYIIVGLGVFKWLLRKLGFSLAPVILGVVLQSVRRQSATGVVDLRWVFVSNY